MARKRGSGDGERQNVTLEIEDVEIEVQVWQGMSGWNASTLIGGRDFRVMGAADRHDALARLRSSILNNVEATYALGVKSRRYWSPNPYWKGR